MIKRAGSRPEAVNRLRSYFADNVKEISHATVIRAGTDTGDNHLHADSSSRCQVHSGLPRDDWNRLTLEFVKKHLGVE